MSLRKNAKKTQKKNEIEKMLNRKEFERMRWKIIKIIIAEKILCMCAINGCHS